MYSEMDVIELVHKSVVLIVLRGGINLNISSEQSRHQWLRHLKELTIRSLCYPNRGLYGDTGGCRNNKASNDTNVGKPHDVECRLSLSVFHKNKTIEIGNNKLSVQVVSDLYPLY